MADNSDESIKKITQKILENNSYAGTVESSYARVKVSQIADLNQEQREKIIANLFNPEFIAFEKSIVTFNQDNNKTEEFNGWLNHPNTIYPNNNWKLCDLYL